MTDLIDFVIKIQYVSKPAEKGSAMVVMSKEDYLAKVISHLQGEQLSQRLDVDTTDWFAEELTSLLVTMVDLQNYTQGYLTIPSPEGSSDFQIVYITKSP